MNIQRADFLQLFDAVMSSLRQEINVVKDPNDCLVAIQSA